MNNNRYVNGVDTLKVRYDDELTTIKTREKLVELGIKKSLEKCYEEYCLNKKHLKSYKIIKKYCNEILHVGSANPYNMGRYYLEQAEEKQRDEEPSVLRICFKCDIEYYGFDYDCCCGKCCSYCKE